MFWQSAWALLSVQQAYAAPNRRAVSSLAVSENVISLQQINASSPSSQSIWAVLAKTGSSKLNLVDGGSGYAVPTKLGDKTFNLIFDTGSSDLWVFKQGVTCVNADNVTINSNKCGFGPEYSGSYSEGTIPDKNLYIEYGSGQFVEGSLGYEPVTIAGVQVGKQEISLVEKAYWSGDGIVSGIVGFAYSSITSQYPGNPPKKDNPNTDEPYSNFFTNAVQHGKTKGLFTVILERGKNPSTVTLGGIPSSLSNVHFTSTPIEKVELEDIGNSATQYSFYTITPSGFVLDGQELSTKFYAIVDSGTTLVYLPGSLAKDVAAQYDPPATMVDGLYATDCNGSPPNNFGVTIGGTTFYISDAELLLQGNLGALGNGKCVIGIQPTASNFGILGDVFLKNVYAVYNQASSQMEFAAHKY